MPDLVQVPADVRVHAPASIEILKSGDALDAGMAVYRASDERYFPAQSDTQEHAAAKYIVLVGCTAADKYFAAVKVPATIGIGAVLALGETYIVSDTPGAIKPIGDAGTGEWVTILGFGKAADEFAINFSYSPAAKP